MISSECVLQIAIYLKNRCWELFQETSAITCRTSNKIEYHRNWYPRAAEWRAWCLQSALHTLVQTNWFERLQSGEHFLTKLKRSDLILKKSVRFIRFLYPRVSRVAYVTRQLWVTRTRRSKTVRYWFLTRTSLHVGPGTAAWLLKSAALSQSYYHHR